MGKGKKGLSEFERYKQKMNIQRRFHSLLGVLMVSALALSLVAGLDYFSGSRFGNLFRSGLAGGSGYPVPLLNHSVRQIEPVNWDAALLSDSSVLIFDSQGSERLSLAHSCATPVLKADGGRLLCYDQGGSQYHAMTSSRVSYSGTAEGSIHAADIASDGSVALATSSAKNATLVTFYDEFGNVTYSWRNSNMVSTMALSPDGRQAAVVLYSAREGEMLTSVVLLNLTKSTVEKPVFSIEIAGEFGYYVAFRENTLTLITDQSVKSIDQMGRVRAEYSFNGQQIQMFADGGSSTVLVLGNYRYMRASQLVSLDERCRVLYSSQLDLSIDSVRANGNGFYLLSEGTLSHYDYKGGLVSQVSTPGAIAWLPLGQNLYAATYEELQKYLIR